MSGFQFLFRDPNINPFLLGPTQHLINITFLYTLRVILNLPICLIDIDIA